MKLITIKDAHFQFGFNPPRGRTKDFEEQIQHKLEQIINYAKQHDIKTLVFTGDTLNYSQSSSYTFDRVNRNLKVFNKLKEQFENIVDIAGNHSLGFSSREYKTQSFHQMLIDLNIIQDATKGIHLDDNTSIYGIDFTPDKEQLLKELQDIDSRTDPESYNIVILHEHLVPNENNRIPFGTCLTYKEITENLKNIDCIIAGHLHKGFPTEVIKSSGKQVTIINQWNLTRLARDYYALNAEHIPQFSVLDTITGKTETINLDVKHFDEAFIIPELNKEKALNQDLNEFIKAVNSIGYTSDSKLPDSIPEEIRNRVEYYIEKAITEN